MIKIERPLESHEVSEALNKPITRKGLPGKKPEIDWARDYYQQKPAPTRAYEFKVYKDKTICLALDAIFFGKCAYCESKYGAVDARNIEHYRPKGNVTEAHGAHQGYWWLAARWSNLLPSCLACNQRRRRVVLDPGMSLEEFERACREERVKLSGKGDSFPVKGDHWVTTETGKLKDEDPLLINPCEEDPAKHLEFFFEWDHKTWLWEADPVYALVRPKLGAAGEDDYGKTSIAIYGLNRAELIRARAERVKEFQGLCQPVVDVTRDLGEAETQAEKDRLEARLMAYRATLVARTRPQQPYAAMAQAFVRQFLEELKRSVNVAENGIHLSIL